VLEPAVRLTAVGAGIMLTGLAGSAAGLVPGLFGQQWRAAAEVLPLACLGLGIAGPVSVASKGYLYAVGQAGTVLRASLLQTIALFATTPPLLPLIGYRAVGHRLARLVPRRRS
jgi:O-antigen/teichoic acid export membrane protein